MVKAGWPVCHGVGPFFDDIPIGQEKQLAYCLVNRERATGFGDFAKLAVAAFDRIGRVEQAVDIRRVVEEGCRVFPLTSYVDELPDKLRKRGDVPGVPDLVRRFPDQLGKYHLPTIGAQDWYSPE